MHDSFIDRGTATATITTKYGGKVNVRSGPGSSYKSVGSLATGTRVTVLLSGNGWSRISGGGLTGYMASSYLSATGSGSGGSGSSGSSGGTGSTSSTTAYVNNPRSTQVLNLRESPSQTARSIGQYRNGTQVKVVSYGSTWCEVYVGTRHGYMMTQYLSFNGTYTPPTYPTTTSVPSYPSATSVPSYPTVTSVPSTPSGSTGPAAGTAGTLAVSAGSGATLINMYAESTLTTVKATYPAGQRMTILQYGPSVCMIMVGTEVGYVSTWNVNY